MRRVWGAAAFLGGLTLAAVALAACGGEGESEPAGSTASPTQTTTATMTPDERAEVEAFLKAASLWPEDLPKGFALGVDRFTDNEERADLSAHIPGARTLTDWNRVGRILGYEATYVAEETEGLQGWTLLSVSTELFQTASGAAESSESGRAEALNPDSLTPSQEWLEQGVQFSNVSISPVPLPELADDRFAAEARATVLHAPGLEDEVPSVFLFAALRRDRAVGMVVWMTFGSEAQAPLVDLARTLDERMKDALEQSPPP